MLFIKESASLRFVRFNRAGEDLARMVETVARRQERLRFLAARTGRVLRRERSRDVADGKVVDIDEEPIQTRHQGVRILHTKKVPILDPSGKPRYLLGISEDITERKRVEEEQQLLADVERRAVGVARLRADARDRDAVGRQRVADWCAIDVIEEDQHIRRLKVASADPAEAALCAVLEQMPPDRDLPHFARFVARGRTPVLLEHVTPSTSSRCAGAGAPASAPRRRITSIIGVPLLLRGKPLGVLVFGSLRTISRLRSARPSLGRSAGGPIRRGDRECASLSRLDRGHPTPRSGARRRRPRPAESAVHDPDAGGALRERGRIRARARRSSTAQRRG